MNNDHKRNKQGGLSKLPCLFFLCKNVEEDFAQVDGACRYDGMNWLAFVPL